jgi:hypothetical protein
MINKFKTDWAGSTTFERIWYVFVNIFGVSTTIAFVFYMNRWKSIDTNNFSSVNLKLALLCLAGLVVYVILCSKIIKRYRKPSTK